MSKEEHLIQNTQSSGFFPDRRFQFACADQGETGFGSGLRDFREDIQQAGMVFLNIEPANMADHKAPLQAVLLPQTRAFLFAESKPRQINRVAHEETGLIPALFAVVIDPRVPAAAPVIGRRSGEEMFAGHFQRILVIPDNLCVVGVSDPDGNPGIFGALKGVKSHGLVVRVDDPDVRVGMQQVRHEPFVAGKMQRV